MKYWIFVATEQRADGRTYKAEEIYRQRMQDGFWGIGARTGNRHLLKRGDYVVFYIGAPAAALIGTAKLASDLVETSAAEEERLNHGKPVYHSKTGVFLEDIETWSQLRPMKSFVNELSFIENTEYWGAYLQGGVREITAEDWRLITQNQPTGLVGQLAAVRDLESEAEFALESHLEEFIARNWHSIDFGAHLDLYSDGEQTGRQFPAGTWSIDFLCSDRTSGDLVVIELKRGKTSDAVVGQLMRYMSWIEDNFAQPNQRVRGIIIARDVDEALKYSIRRLNDVELLVYKVDFHLSRYNG